MLAEVVGVDESAHTSGTWMALRTVFDLSGMVMCGYTASRALVLIFFVMIYTLMTI
jgi:hypothetical protein